MLSSPASPYAALFQPAQKFVVLLGPADGSAPALGTNEVQWLIPQRFSITAGGGRDDVMVFNVDLGKLGQRLVDTKTPVSVKRQVEVRTLDDKGVANTILAWGYLSKNPQSIDGESESTIFEARLSKHHYGKPLTSYPIYDVGGFARLDLNRPLIFNPEIDEIVEPNMSSFTDATKLWAYVIDPESLRTQAAKTRQFQTAAAWKLSDAVLACCWWLNPSETFIKNPTKQDLQMAFTDRDTMLKNVEIPMGTWLPDVLDQLLTPFEYGWYLKHSISGARITTIQFFARGAGIKKKLYLQRPGDTRDIKKTSVEGLDIEYSINDLANRIEVWGDYRKVEATFPLAKGWSNTYDTTQLADLEKGQSLAELHPAVGRKWILNEASDYDGLRPEITAPYSFASIFGSSIQSIRRRKFMRCLSQHIDADDLESNGIRVDWYDSDITGAVSSTISADPGWIKVKWPFSVLEKECGILFEGTTPPDRLWEYIAAGTPEKALVRITATVIGDQRVNGIATRQAKSPNGQDVTLVLDLHDRFQLSKVDSSSIFSSRPSIARDDSTVIQTYAQSVRDIEDAMKVHCSITLEGVAHPEYQIGDRIDNVSGRNLTLNGYDETGGTNTRNPQIVGIVYHLAGGQRMELMLDSFERERPQIVMDNHQRTLA